MKSNEFYTFWREAVLIKGSVTPIVIFNVFVFGLIAAFICVVDHYIEDVFQVNLGLEVGPHEIAGAALGLLLILRTNAGYDRWWEGRTLWGGIVNQTRNLALESRRLVLNSFMGFLLYSFMVWWLSVLNRASRSSNLMRPHFEARFQS